MKSGLDHARIRLEKAGNDLKLAAIGFEHDAPTDTVAFHLQQMAEKTWYLLSLPAFVIEFQHSIKLCLAISV